jgi:DNA repair exonuclease SbcCD ATPase subunit
MEREQIEKWRHRWTQSEVIDAELSGLLDLALKGLQAEIVQFSPTGDNHHNAWKCPYCRPEMEKERKQAEAMREANAELHQELADLYGKYETVRENFHEVTVRNIVLMADAEAMREAIGRTDTRLASLEVRAKVREAGKS